MNKTFVVLFLTISILSLVSHTKAVETIDENIKIDNDIGSENIGHKTDDLVNQKKEEHDQTTKLWTEKYEKELKDSMENYKFKAHTSKVMEIIVNSIYSNKDIFLRELISNASDALNKLRFLSLTDSSILGEGDNQLLEILIDIDEEKRILNIRDRGLGMTKKDLTEKIGKIAESGSKDFIDKLQKKDDSIIGQFGVGFYSVFLVADEVTIYTKHYSEEEQDQLIWKCNVSIEDGNENIQSGYTISVDPRGNTLGRGTTISLHIKEGEQYDKYLKHVKLQKLIEKYSRFIDFPIYLWKSEWEDIEVTATESDDDQEEEQSIDTESEEEIEEEAEKVEKEKKTKIEQVERWKWVLMNKQKAIWTRPKSEITEDEYNEFYRLISKNNEDPFIYTHFIAEGDVEFKSILFIPGTIPFGSFERFNPKIKSVKLYVRRVFITDNFMDELVPQYLAFLVGVVDGDNLPLNLSREQLQKHVLLKKIKKMITKKTIAMFKKLLVVKDLDDEDALEQRDKFWETYGTNLKVGALEEKDATIKKRIRELLRFKTSKSGDGFITLDEYIERMDENQKKILYIGGTNSKVLMSSPHLEKVLKKDWEVIFCTDPIDEYLFLAFRDEKYKGYEVSDMSKESIDVKEISEKEKKKIEELEEEHSYLLEWFKEIGGDQIDKVRFSKKLIDSPCVVSTKDFGVSARMERILKNQALNNRDMNYIMGLYKKTFELNPRHPLILALDEAVKKDPEDETIKKFGQLLFDTALIGSDIHLENVQDYTKLVFHMMSVGLDVDLDTFVPQTDSDVDNDDNEEDSLFDEDEDEEIVDMDETSYKDEL
ncbi:endoplasmin [Anaeramoeba flamelloides]|uniref:Endoplasmin n=1 Tax=Anaeramoeba flamelloides TaxID=1746091 RepID=A0AAV7YW92_9EUKA|nr:endoplasmin [Anaeramoeba flamelloides]